MTRSFSILEDMNTTTLAALAKILRDEKILASDASSLPDVRVTGCACDSRVVRPGDLFVCKGVMFRDEFLTSAVERGAVAYLCDPARAERLLGWKASRTIDDMCRDAWNFESNKR